MSSMHDPLRNVDPWDHIEQRKKKYEDPKAEFQRVFLAPYIAADIELSLAALDRRLVVAAHYELESGQVLYNVHDESRCEGQPCAIHHPSPHALSTRPRCWIDGKIYRTCEHDVNHPDYDSIANLLDRQGWIWVRHRCCKEKCCGIPELVEIDG